MSILLYPIKYNLLTITVLFSVFISASVSAQHADIWLVLNANQTAVSATNLETLSQVKLDFESRKFLFTGDFSDVGQGPNGTDDPGFQAEVSTFNSGVILNFRAVGSLRFWDGGHWVNTLVDQERVQIEDALSNMTTIDSSGVSNAEGAIDQIASDGSVHQHVDFSIDNTLGSGTVAPGAYMIELEFYSTNGVGGPIVHTVSESVLIVHNYQLSSSEFDAVILQLTEPEGVSVPIPGVVLLLFAVLLAIIGGKARSFNTHRKEIF